MKKIEDPEYWREASMDCPFFPDEAAIHKIRSEGGNHPDAILGVPGIRIKACLEYAGWKHFGCLVKYKGSPLKWSSKIVEDDVVVLDPQDQKTVWFGTVEQYEQMWCVD